MPIDISPIPGPSGIRSAVLDEHLKKKGRERLEAFKQMGLEKLAAYKVLIKRSSHIKIHGIDGFTSNELSSLVDYSMDFLKKQQNGAFDTDTEGSDTDSLMTDDSMPSIC